MDERALSIRDMLWQLTQGRPYIFVIMAYRSRYALYERIRAIAQKEFGIVCVRADDVKGSGCDLLAKIHQLIDRAELVIAEISEGSENVFYEIGYAVGGGRSPLLLMERGKAAPTDLKGLETVEYGTDRDGMRLFDADLADHIRLRMNTELPVLRDMLEAPIQQPVYIVASPKYPGKHCRIKAQVYDKRTFGDHLGVLGLVSAFGAMVGFGHGVELVSAQHSDRALYDEPLSLYLIGSPKANPGTGIMLKGLVGGQKEPSWSFGPKPGFTLEDEDWPVGLYRTCNGITKEIVGVLEKRGEKQEEIWTEDYGLIIRGPHPTQRGRIVLIMAGPHSLGTGAACLAATRSPLIQQIRAKLPEHVLEDKERTFWVLVKGTAGSDGMLDVERVSVEGAGVYA